MCCVILKKRADSFLANESRDKWSADGNMADSIVVVRVFFLHIIGRTGWMPLQLLLKFAGWKGRDSWRRYCKEVVPKVQIWRHRHQRQAHMGNDEALRQAVEDAPSASTRCLSAQVDPSWSPIFRHLQELRFSSRQPRCIRNALAPQQAHGHLPPTVDKPTWQKFLRRMVTEDEQWISCCTPTQLPNGSSLSIWWGGCPTRHVREEG